MYLVTNSTGLTMNTIIVVAALSLVALLSCQTVDADCSDVPFVSSNPCLDCEYDDYWNSSITCRYLSVSEIV